SKLDAEIESEIFSISRELLLRELRHYQQSAERVPSALLTSAMTALKATGTTERIAEQAGREEAAASSHRYVSRLAPQWIGQFLSYEEQDPFAGISEEDYENVAKKARFLAKTLDERSPERVRLEELAREADRRDAAGNVPPIQ